MKKMNQEEQNSFNKDFNKLLELIHGDVKFSESVAESFVTSLCEIILHKKQVYFPHRDDYLLVLYWNRFSGEIKTVSIDNTSYLIVEERDFEWHDMISWFPLWSTTTTKLNQLKTFQSKVGINLNSVKDQKELDNLKPQFSEFLKKMISSNLLKEQKIIFESKQKNNYNYFFKKVDNVAYQYPLDLYSEKVRFETLWSRLKPFCKFIDSYFISKVTTKKNYVSIYNLIFDSENKLKHPFNVFEQEFIDKTVSLLNEPSLDGNYRSDLIKFLEKLVDDEIKITSYIKDNFQVLEEGVDDYLAKLHYELFENKDGDIQNQTKEMDPFDLVGSQFSFDEIIKARSVVKNKVFDFLKKNQNRPARYSSFVFKGLYEEFTENDYLVEAFYFESSIYLEARRRSNLVYSPMDSNLRFISLPSMVWFSKIEGYVKQYNIKTTKEVQKGIKNLIESPFVIFSNDELEHLKFVLEMETI